MIGAVDAWVDVSVASLEAFGEGVVDTPAGFGFAGVVIADAEAPPSVGDFVGVFFAPDVVEAGLEVVFEAGAFFVGEAVFAFFVVGVGDVDGFVGDVEIAEEEDFFVGF